MVHFHEAGRLLGNKGASWGMARSAVPGFAVPSDHAREQRLDVARKPIEQRFALLRGSKMRLADMADRAAFPRNPTPSRRGKRGAELHWRRVLIVTDQVRREAEHHRRLPFASMP